MAIYHLTLRGSLHQGEFIGIHREGVLDRVPSDSLFAAFVVAWLRTGADIKSRLRSMEEEDRPPFILTSGFPLAGEIRFYPAPPILPPHAGFPPSEKAAKKIRWLSEGILRVLQNGETPAHDSDTFLHGKTTWVTPEELAGLQPLLMTDLQGNPGLWGEQVVPRVTVDRVRNASNLFFTGRTEFAENCGLWFAVRGDTEWVEESMGVLQDQGLGGLRSIGHGTFNWKLVPGSVPAPAPDGWGYSLGRFAPRNVHEAASLKDQSSAYALEVVGGWCTDETGQAWRRRSVRMVSEGALLPAGNLVGKAVDVRPEAWYGPIHPVWRVGYAFFIPARKLVEAV